MKSNSSYGPEMPKLGQNLFDLCDLDIWLLTSSFCMNIWFVNHYSDVIMNKMASQITSHIIIYSTVFFRRRSKKTSKLRVTCLCAGNSPVTGEFLAQRASNAENISIWWRHFVVITHEIAMMIWWGEPCQKGVTYIRTRGQDFSHSCLVVTETWVFPFGDI